MEVYAITRGFSITEFGAWRLEATQIALTWTLFNTQHKDKEAKKMEKRTIKYTPTHVIIIIISICISSCFCIEFMTTMTIMKMKMNKEGFSPLLIVWRKWMKMRQWNIHWHSHFQTHWLGLIWFGLILFDFRVVISKGILFKSCLCNRVYFNSVQFIPEQQNTKPKNNNNNNKDHDRRIVDSW